MSIHNYTSFIFEVGRCMLMLTHGETNFVCGTIQILRSDGSGLPQLFTSMNDALLSNGLAYVNFESHEERTIMLIHKTANEASYFLQIKTKMIKSKH
jgi:hypothetical protein